MLHFYVLLENFGIDYQLVDLFGAVVDKNGVCGMSIGLHRDISFLGLENGKKPKARWDNGTAIRMGGEDSVPALRGFGEYQKTD